MFSLSLDLTDYDVYYYYFAFDGNKWTTTFPLISFCFVQVVLRMSKTTQYPSNL